MEIFARLNGSFRSKTARITLEKRDRAKMLSVCTMPKLKMGRTACSSFDLPFFFSQYIQGPLHIMLFSSALCNILLLCKMLNGRRQKLKPSPLQLGNIYNNFRFVWPCRHSLQKKTLTKFLLA